VPKIHSSPKVRLPKIIKVGQCFTKLFKT